MLRGSAKYTLVGLQIGNLFVIEDLGVERPNPKTKLRRFYICLCKCGNTIKLRSDIVLTQKSCGCINAARKKIEIYETDYKIDESGCWIWQRTTSGQGYGRLRLPFKTKWFYFAHRLSYEYFKGQIAEGLVIDHICRVRNCINPEHLRAVTPRQNALENSQSICVKHSLKNQCHNGHEFIKRKNTNGRTCPSCNRLRSKRWHQRQKLEKLSEKNKNIAQD